MTTLDIQDEVYEDWIKFYNKQDKLRYPTLKNFTARKLREIMQEHDYLHEKPMERKKPFIGDEEEVGKE